MSLALARALNNYPAATQLAGERDRWTPVKPLIHRTNGRNNMADDRMKNDDLQRNMGGTGAGEGQDFGKQNPGRGGQGGQQHGQQGAGKHSGGQYGAGQDKNMEDEDLRTSAPGKAGGQNRGGQNR